MATTMVDQYEVMYAANTFAPRIWLKSGGSFVGQLVFRPNGTALPPDTSQSLYYHLDDFANALNLLRNEKPVYWMFNGSGGGFENGIKTTAEPVGEGESMA